MRKLKASYSYTLSQKMKSQCIGRYQTFYLSQNVHIYQLLAKSFKDSFSPQLCLTGF